MVVRIIIIVGAVNKQANGTSTSDPLHHPSSAPMDSLTVLFQYHGHTHPSLPQHLCVSLHICSRRKKYYQIFLLIMINKRESLELVSVDSLSRPMETQFSF